jgi:hypothetical protein
MIRNFNSRHLTVEDLIGARNMDMPNTLSRKRKPKWKADWARGMALVDKQYKKSIGAATRSRCHEPEQ